MQPLGKSDTLWRSADDVFQCCKQNAMLDAGACAQAVDKNHCQHMCACVCAWACVRAWAPAVGMTHSGALYSGMRACYICLRSGWGSDGNVYNALRG